MILGFVGLGKMGSRMVLNLISKGHRAVVYNRTPEATVSAAKRGAVAAYSLKELAARLPKNKVVWLMVPAGKPIDDVISGLSPYLSKGDVIIDGGNSFYKDSIRRYNTLRKRGISFVDCGTSGGLKGARYGACLTIGGDYNVYKRLWRLFKGLSAPGGYGYVGPSGAGHYVKVIHNGIEYALLQSYGEGFEALYNSPYKLNLAKIAGVWSHGSIIRSYLSELAVSAFKKHPAMKGVPGAIGGGETGKWALSMAKEGGAESGMLKLAFTKRRQSQKKESFASKVVAALRNEFGGHEFVKPKKKD